MLSCGFDRQIVSVLGCGGKTGTDNSVCQHSEKVKCSNATAVASLIFILNKAACVFWQVVYDGVIWHVGWRSSS